MFNSNASSCLFPLCHGVFSRNLLGCGLNITDLIGLLNRLIWLVFLNFSRCMTGTSRLTRIILLHLFVHLSWLSSSFHWIEARSIYKGTWVAADTVPLMVSLLDVSHHWKRGVVILGKTFLLSSIHCIIVLELVWINIESPFWVQFPEFGVELINTFGDKFAAIVMIFQFNLLKTKIVKWW